MDTNNPLTILPLDAEKKTKILIQRFSKQEGADFWDSLSDIMPAIELAVQETKIRFFLDMPIFFHEGRIYQVNNYNLNEQFFKTLQTEYNRGKLFAIKTLFISPLLNTNKKQYCIRGCFILDCDKIISKDRDSKLEQLIELDI